jgi:hypothetical protein
MAVRSVPPLIICLALSLAVYAVPPEPKHVTQSLRGKVLWTAEALEKHLGIESDPDWAQASVSLVTPEGRVHPLVKDDRGRGFLKDARLRNRDLELLVRRHEGSPFLQVIGVYTIKDGRKHSLEYWCDICAIIMYELQDCECCQGPIELREVPVTETPQP